MAADKQEAEVVTNAVADQQSVAHHGEKVALKNWEPEKYMTHPALPGARVDPLLVPILDQEFGADGQGQPEFRARIQASIEKTEADGVRHGLTLIATPYTVGQSFVTHGNPEHKGEQRLYFHIDPRDPTAGIVYPEGKDQPIPAHVFMRHELAHVAQNRGGYDSPLSALSDKPIGKDGESRESDAYGFETSFGPEYRNGYGDGVTRVDGKVIQGIRNNPDNPSLNGQVWGRVIGWPEQESRVGPQSNRDQISLQQRVATVAGRIKGEDLTDQQKAQLYSLVAENANKAGLALSETQVPEQEQTRSSSISLG